MSDFGEVEKVKLNRSGVRKLLRSAEALQMVNDIAYSAAAKLGDGYSVNYRVGRNRVIAEVTADSMEARQENLETNSILKAVQASV